MTRKVAVLMGGTSFEREVSLASGKRVCEALEKQGYNVISLDITKELVPALRSERPDVCYIALQGKYGEEGTIQSLLDFLGIPYVGSLAQVCRNVCNKAQIGYLIDQYCERVDEERVAFTPAGFCLGADAFKEMGLVTALDMVAERIPAGYPVCVKPARGSLAMGVHKVDSQEELEQAIFDALAFDNEVIIKEWVEGVELSVSILGGGWNAHTLPPVEIVTKEGYVIQADRLAPEGVEYYAPVRLESLSKDEANAQAIRAEIERAALQVYNALDCKDLGRVDLIWDGATARILDVDVSPDLTASSLFPMACEASGLSLEAVLDRLVQVAE